MTKISELEAKKYLNQAIPIAKELYATNEDYRRLVAAYYLRLKCSRNIWHIGMRVGGLNEQTANFLVNQRTGNWRIDNEYYPWPLNDEMYENMYYMQRAYLSIVGLGQKIAKGPQGNLYSKLYDLECRLEDYNAEHWYITHKMEDNGALLVNTEYSRYYDISISKFVSAIHAFPEVDTRRYMSIKKKDMKACEIAAEYKLDPTEFCSWNGWKNTNLTVPAGFVYVRNLKKY